MPDRSRSDRRGGRFRHTRRASKPHDRPRQLRHQRGDGGHSRRECVPARAALQRSQRRLEAVARGVAGARVIPAAVAADAGEFKGRGRITQFREDFFSALSAPLRAPRRNPGCGWPRCVLPPFKISLPSVRPSPQILIRCAWPRWAFCAFLRLLIFGRAVASPCYLRAPVQNQSAFCASISG